MDAKVRFGFFLIFLCATLILLGLGSRMLVMIAIISAMIDFYYRHKVKGGSLFLFFVAAVLVVVFMLMVGVVRDGSDVDVQSVIGIFIAEPLFTSIGSIRYFIFTDGRPYVNFPFDVVAGFVNFVPSIIFPQKVAIFELLGGLDWNYSPFGASALLVNLYKNFGMAYPIFMMVLASYFTFLQINSRISGLYRSIYFSCLPLLLFYVHREGFVTVIKVLLFNGLILPVFLIAVLKFLTGKSELEDRRPNA